MGLGDARRSHRHELDLEVRWTIRGQSLSGTGTLLDVNLRGARIRIDQIFSVRAGTTFELHVAEIPAMPPAARLRWFRGVGRGQPHVLCGLTFLEQGLETSAWTQWIRDRKATEPSARARRLP